MSGLRIVLVGAGHAHIHLLRRGSAITAAGHDLVLVSPDDFWYSGLATGVLAGQYPPEADRVEVAPLVGRAGGRWIRDRVARLDPSSRRLYLADGDPLGWDLLSLDVGSRPPATLPGAAEHALPVRPVRDLLRLPERLAREGGGRVVVIGGGASGCEVALALEARGRRDGIHLDVTVVSEGPVLEAALGPGAGDAMARELVSRGVRVLEGVRVGRVGADAVGLEDGRVLAGDVVVDATGVAPPPLLADSGLPVDGEGALRVDGHLRSVAEPTVFGAGDCVRFMPRKLPRVGVYAIRQAPVLLHNLLAAAAGRPLATFRPQKRFLLVLNLGDGRGLAVRGGLRWRGRAAFVLKDWLDRRFLEAG